MGFFDWLWGRSQIGWLKSALLSILFGAVIIGLTTGFSVPGGSYFPRFLVFLTGGIALWFFRLAYWSWRRGNLWSGIHRGKARAFRAVIALSWRRPQLAPEFADVLAFYREAVVVHQSHNR